MIYGAEKWKAEENQNEEEVEGKEEEEVEVWRIFCWVFKTSTLSTSL